MDGYSALRWTAVVAALFLSACASTRVDPPHLLEVPQAFDGSSFGPRPAIPAADDLFALPEADQRAFLAFFGGAEQSATPAHERIYHYIAQTTADFDFHSETRTAAETLAASAGNCLSLAILTTALARLGDVDTGYLLVDSTPVFERRGGVVSKGIHVRSILYDPAWEPELGRQTAQLRPGIQFDYFPDATDRKRIVGNLSSDAYVAMYYSNKAGEALAKNDIDTAFWYSLESLKQDRRNVIALNTLAIVYRRAGDEMMAERIYQYGIEELPKNASFLRNYLFLLKRQGRTEEANTIRRSLAKLDDRNPFNWVNAGRSALEEGEYREAIRHLRAALEIAPYLHEAYALIAIAHLRMGNADRGKENLQQALDNAQRVSVRSLYQAKLTMFDR